MKARVKYIDGDIRDIALSVDIDGKRLTALGGELYGFEVE